MLRPWLTHRSLLSERKVRGCVMDRCINRSSFPLARADVPPYLTLYKTEKLGLLS